MLSIVVPVFNVAQYLRHCLQSLDEQGLTDYEVILINDASTDNSRGICSEWCEDHPHFKLINHDHNQGLSAARNTGIRLAKGEWITFVDSDDFLAPDTLKKALEATFARLEVGDQSASRYVDQSASRDVDQNTFKVGNQEGTTAVCPLVVEYPIMQYHLSDHPALLTFTPSVVSFEQWLMQGGHKHCYACNKLFHRSLWEGVEFPVGKRYEDIFTIPEVLRRAGSIRQVDVGMYYYCERHGSIVTTAGVTTWRDYLVAYNRLLEMPENQKNHDLYLRARNGEIMYRRVSGDGSLIVHRRHIPLSFAFSKGLTWHDRLKVLWFWLG